MWSVRTDLDRVRGQQAAGAFEDGLQAGEATARPAPACQPTPGPAGGRWRGRPKYTRTLSPRPVISIPVPPGSPPDATRQHHPDERTDEPDPVAPQDVAE